MISALHAIAIANPDALDDLSDVDLALVMYTPEMTLRPEQRVPRDRAWRSAGFLSGRGWGKTFGIACEVNRRIEAGTCTSPAIIAPNLDRVRDVQVTALLATASAWCPCEEYRGGVRWANGVVAAPRTAEVERPSSGDNFDLTWMTEIVRWPASTRRAAFDDITTATRIGRAQYLWDTTSSGKNDVIALLLEQHAADPRAHRITRGTMFENPLLTRTYLRDEARKYGRGTRRYDEEILGLVFSEAAGALWEQDWIDPYRVHAPPASFVACLLGVDPAGSDSKHADEVGIAKAWRTSNGHAYLDDLSGRMSPLEYAEVIVRECQRDAAGAVVERNHFGAHARELIGQVARNHGMRYELLPDPKRPFPPRRPGTVYIREIVSHASKDTRAAPVAAIANAGKLHHVGTLAQLEYEMTTWEPGTRRSPNRLDAAVFAVTEIAGVTRDVPRDARRELAAAKRASALLERMRGAGRAR